jgi:hypothetical protein
MPNGSAGKPGLAAELSQRAGRDVGDVGRGGSGDMGDVPERLND